ncbi:hypothetical protein ACFL27_13780 [candidate division CSSED10-310 bacterium]|uniref:BIG2 domain-containing protein n=1 Tax=candidate division CSSED10-310 bacterium TaxID=2855610 RepID=A0ABV6YYH9_UNCC1
MKRLLYVIPFLVLMVSVTVLFTCTGDDDDDDVATPTSTPAEATPTSTPASPTPTPTPVYLDAGVLAYIPVTGKQASKLAHDTPGMVVWNNNDGMDANDVGSFGSGYGPAVGAYIKICTIAEGMTNTWGHYSFQGLPPGMYMITVTLEGYVGVQQLTVIDDPNNAGNSGTTYDNFGITPYDVTVSMAYPYSQLTAYYYDPTSNSYNTVEYSAVNWTVADPTIVQMDQETGILEGIAPGDTMVTGTWGGNSAYATVLITEHIGGLKGLVTLDGQPVEGAQITFNQVPHCVETGSDGLYQVPGLSATNLDVRASYSDPNGNYGTGANVTIPPNEYALLDLIMNEY